MTIRRFLTNRRFLVGAVALGAVGLALSGLTPATASGPPVAAPARALPVLAAAVETVDGYEVERSYSGVLRPRRTADLAWEAAGRVIEIHVDEADPVAEGQVLARLEDERSVAELAALRAQRARAASVLDELLRGPRAQTVEVARADVRALEEELELARLQRGRREQLLHTNAVSKEEVDAAVTNQSSRAARLEAARQRLDELEEGTRVEDVEQQRAALRELDARVERAEVDLADRELRAPFAGVVTRRDLDEGAVVEAGHAVLHLIENGALEARIGVPIERAFELRVGQEIELEVRGGRLAALVAALVPEMDATTRTVDVIVALDEVDSLRHVSGEVARLVVAEHVRTPGTWVPTAALVPGARGLWAAYALVPHAGDPARSVVERRELEVLHTTGPRALVRGTIRDGDRLVVDGVHRVVPGQVVEAQ